MNLRIQSLHLERQPSEPNLLNLGRGKVYRELHRPVERRVHTPQTVQHPRYEGITRSHSATEVHELCQQSSSRTAVISTVTKRWMQGKVADWVSGGGSHLHTQQFGRLCRFGGNRRRFVRLPGYVGSICEWRGLRERPRCTA